MKEYEIPFSSSFIFPFPLTSADVPLQVTTLKIGSAFYISSRRFYNIMLTSETKGPNETTLAESNTDPPPTARIPSILF